MQTSRIIPFEEQARNYLICEVAEPMSRTGKAFELKLFVDINDGFGFRLFDGVHQHDSRKMCERVAGLFVSGKIARNVEKHEFAPGVTKAASDPPYFLAHAFDEAVSRRIIAGTATEADWRYDAANPHIPHPKNWTKARLDRLEGIATSPKLGAKAIVLGDGTAVKEGDTARFGQSVEKDFRGVRVEILKVQRTKVVFKFIDGPKANDSGSFTINVRALVRDTESIS